MPPNTNPAEFMLDLVNNEFTDPESVAEVIDVWVRPKHIINDNDSNDVKWTMYRHRDVGAAHRGVGVGQPPRTESSRLYAHSPWT